MVEYLRRLTRDWTYADLAVKPKSCRTVFLITNLLLSTVVLFSYLLFHWGENTKVLEGCKSQMNVFAVTEFWFVCVELYVYVAEYFICLKVPSVIWSEYLHALTYFSAFFPNGFVCFCSGRFCSLRVGLQTAWGSSLICFVIVY